jgi:Beta-ketoacyl synthase, N-terminal domain/Aminotransferase class I and II
LKNEEKKMLSGKIINLKRVVITGMGLISPLGNSVASSWDNLLAGRSGISRLSKFAADVEDFRLRYKAPDDFPTIAGEVKNFDFKTLLEAYKPEVTKEDLKLTKYTDSFTQYALAASYEAISRSALDLGAVDPERLGTIIASGMGGVASWEEAYRKLDEGGVKRVSPFMVPKLLPNLAAGNVAISLGAQGPNTALSSACAAGGNERRKVLVNGLKKLGFAIPVEPTGAFYVFVNARHLSLDSYQLAFDILEKAHVGVTPGVDFGSEGEGSLRFSYANSMENITLALQRLEDYLALR